MPYSNPVVGGTALVRPAINSPNYVAGASGWSINRDGTTEFNDTTVRGSLFVVDSEGNVIISLSGNPGPDGNYLAIIDANGDVVANITADGNASFQDVNIVQSPTIAGLDFQSGIIDPLPRGPIAFGQITSGTDTTTGEKGIFEIDFSASFGRQYRITAGFWAASSVANDQIVLNVRYTTDGTSPTVTSQQIARAAHGVSVAFAGEFFGFSELVTLPTASYRMLLTFGRQSGTGTITHTPSLAQPTELTIEDVGLPAPNLAVPNTGGGTNPPVQQYTATFSATWVGSYDGAGNLNSFGGASRAYQGDAGDGQGNRKALIGFNYAAIQSALAGATINACSVTLYFEHWWLNAGGTAVIGTHNQAVSSAPATFGSNSTNRVQSSGWPNPGLRTVDLGVTIGQNFRDGTAKGLTLGPGPSSSQTYYGYAAGVGTNSAVIKITYTK